MLKSIFGAGSENRGKRLLVTGMYGLLNSAGGRKTNGIGILGMMSSVSGDGMVKGECVRGKASRRWLWGLVWWSTAESKGWKEEFGDFLGYVNGECMARRGDTWPITCGKLGPTGWLISGQVVQGGTFAWRCGVAGLAGGRRLTCGVQGVGPDVYVWSDGLMQDDYEDDYGVWMFRRWIITEGAATMGNIIEGSLTYGYALQMPKEGSLTLGVGRVLFICFGDTKRSILWGGLVGKERCVFWSQWVGIKRYVLKEEKRCVSRPRWVGVKRGVLEEEKRCVLELNTGFDGGGLRTEKRNVWTMCCVNCVPYCLATVSFRMRSCVLKSDSRKVICWVMVALVLNSVSVMERCVLRKVMSLFLLVENGSNCSDFIVAFLGLFWDCKGKFRGSYMKNLSVLKEFVVVERESWFVDFFIVLRKVCSMEMGDSVWKKKSQSFTGIVDEFLKFHRHVHGIASKLDRGYERCFGGNGCAGHEMGGKEDFKGRQWWCSWWWLRKSTVESKGRSLLLEEIQYKRIGSDYCLEMLKRGVFGVCLNELKRCVLVIDLIKGKQSVLASQPVPRYSLISGLLRSKRSVLKQIDDDMKHSVLKSVVGYTKRCVLRMTIVTIRSVLGSGFNLSLYLESVSIYRIFSGFFLRFIIAICGSNFWCKRIFVMADEVANLMNNLRFSEEELVEMENMENQCKEQQCDTEKWIVAKLFTMRKVDGAAVLRVFGSVWKEQPLEEVLDLGANFFLFNKPTGEEGPYQFGEWLRVPFAKKKNAVQGGKKQGIVFTAKGMGERESSHGRGKNMGTLYQAEGSGEGKGKQLQHAQLRPRGPKRVLQGKFEVCPPIGPKKARSASNSQGSEIDGGLEVVSPLKTSITVEAAMQPRREP
ncbi:hypothetical protein V6N11_025431 [Hibiscus sabdariffa]|uniref:DUF4283 domain-containing protein n=1 Tax=Hibiscus sabdariffa TaxID=183260 RepID=A0ABR2N9Z5_9ROSI